MLAILSPLSNCDGRELLDEFSDEFLGEVPLQLEDINIDFDDDIFGFGGDLLPELGDPDEIFADFCIDRYGKDVVENEAKAVEVIRKCDEEKELFSEKEEEQKEVESANRVKEEDPNAVSITNSLSSLQKTEKSSKGKGSQGKRKVKVDWTPELHRRFVQAVEQLGLEKAVPSRILELMGIDCLTRHNIASHLQKYRSHRKHLQAREAEAASWRQRQHMYSSSVTAGEAKKETNIPWRLPPTMALPSQNHPAYRPLHVWGHPPLDPNLVHLWPKHLNLHQPTPPMPWALPPPPLPPPHLSFWPTPYPTGSNALTHGMPYFPRPLPAMRFSSPSVAGIPPLSLYGPESAVCLKGKQLASFETHDPSKDNIDALIVDVIAKPWLPLPLGLKAPSVESVITELQKQGISKIPPNN